MSTTTSITPEQANEILSKAGYAVALPLASSLPLGNGQERIAQPDSFVLTALDWHSLLAAGLPEIRWLRRPYIPAGARVWLWGPAESGKSIWAAWTAAELTREGLDVVYVSQENPLVEEVRRWDRLRPDWERLAFYHDQGLDLATPEHVAELVRVSAGASLVVLDTLTACWSGDEGDNAEIAAFDRDVLIPLREASCSVLVIDHTGHPQAFIKRRGVSAGRGASAKGQKADSVLEFRPEGPGEFVIDHAKGRLGGERAPTVRFRVVDAEDGSLGIEAVGSEDGRTLDVAEAIVAAVREAGFLTTKALRAAVRGVAGVELQNEAMQALQEEDPARVRVSSETVDTPGGRHRARVWRTVE